MIAMEMAHDHARHPGGINAGGAHVCDHAAIGRSWGGDAIATVEHHQIAARIQKGYGERDYQSVLRQKGVAQHGLHLSQGGIANKAFQWAGKKPIMHGGHGKRPDLEAIKAGRLRCRRGLGRCSPHKGGRGQQGSGRDKQTTPKCNHHRAPDGFWTSLLACLKAY